MPRPRRTRVLSARNVWHPTGRRRPSQYRLQRCGSLPGGRVLKFSSHWLRRFFFFVRMTREVVQHCTIR